MSPFPLLLESKLRREILESLWSSEGTLQTVGTEPDLIETFYILGYRLKQLPKK